MTEMPEPTRYGEAVWLEPYPDVLLEGIPDQAPGPEARYEAKEAIARFLRDRATRRGANLRLVPTRGNGQPGFGCYLPDAHASIARAYGLMILTLTDDSISAITWFGERSLVTQFGLPRALPQEE